MKYRKKEDGTYQGTTWQIKFKLDNVKENGTYKLRLALATANVAELQVYKLTKILSNSLRYSGQKKDIITKKKNSLR